MKKILVILVFFSFSSVLFAQQEFGGNGMDKDYNFGVRIVTTGAGVGRFYAIYSTEGKIERVATLSKKNFVRISLGLLKSEHNNYEINYFTEYAVIDSVKLMSNIASAITPRSGDSNFDEDHYEYQKRNRYNNSIVSIANDIIGDLWKLRFAKYPYGGALDTMGWTQNFDNLYMPRPEQMNILKGYGIERIDDYIWGDNLFRLLKDIRNPVWIQTYSEAGAEE